MAAGLYDITNEILGKGHFAVVKLARHCLTSELVAVKIIDKTKLNKEGLQQQSQEVKILSRLSQHEHPNIVKLYQVIDTKSKLYLVMEYCGRDVCDLYDYIQRKLGGSGLDEPEAKHIFRQICSAIAYCHSLKIVHRDLKPENLLILTQPVLDDDQATSNTLASWPQYPIVKLIDFGFANQWVEGIKLRTSCGSLAYSAPEILLGDQYDGDKVDIWGLGCILYILLYGCNPFMQINDSETLIRILDCSFQTPSRPNISQTAIDLIRSLLKRDPSSRLTMKQVVNNKWFTGTSETSSAVTSGQESPNHNHNSTSKSTSSPTVTTADVILSDFTRRSSSGTMAATRPVPVPLPPSSTFTPRVKSPPSGSPSPPPFNPPPSAVVDKAVSSEVHNRVIDQMINQKMCTSKESVERALKSTRISSGSNRSSISSLSNLPIVEEVVLATENEESPTVTKESNSEASGGNDGYISATYNLLKDKLLREIQGLPSSSTNVHEIRTQHKRGHILPGRQRKPGVSQAPRFNRPSAGVLDEFSLKQKLQEVDTMEEIDTMDEGLALPLQRKCSIVSEEGSVCELSGRLSHAGSDVHTFLLGDDKEPIVVRNPIPAVDIVITDFSVDDPGDEIDGTLPIDGHTVTPEDGQSESGNQPDVMVNDVNDNLDLAADVDLKMEPPSSSQSNETTSSNNKNESETNCSRPLIDLCTVTSTSSQMASIPISLMSSSQKHFVSSSPDLSRQLASHGIGSSFAIGSNYNDNDLAMTDDVFDDTSEVSRTRTSTATSRHDAKSGQRSVIVGYGSKDQVVDDVADHVLASRQGRRSSKTGSTSADSGKGDQGVMSPPPVTNRSATNSSMGDDSKSKQAVMFNLDPRTVSSSIPTSVRVITQSKSCSNILSQTMSSSGSNPPSRKSSTKKSRFRNGGHEARASMDNPGVQQKSSPDDEDEQDESDRRKGERVDCCNIS